MSSSEFEEAFLESAREAFRRDPGVASLDSLGVWDLLGELSEAEARTALDCVFRAHGRELASTAALGCLMAHPYVAEDNIDPGAVAMALPRRSPRRGDRLMLLGDLSAEQVLIDRPGSGATLVPLRELDLEPVANPGRLALHEFSFDASGGRLAVPEARAEPARVRSRFLGRVAAAFEILGAAEGALDLALEHAATREQFGQPIGKFQAVRHLLAWAQCDAVAIQEVCQRAAELDALAPVRFDEIAKALAGRNGLRICERALQVLGGIGFTAEQEHHHFHSRVLALDALLGSSAELANGLGAWLRDARSDPRVPRALLDGGSLA